MINFDERIIELFSEQAKQNVVDTINIGLGYTAVVLKNNQCGVCCTLLDSNKGCSVYKIEEDFENRSCYDLLISLKRNKDFISRSIVIAMVNALTQDYANRFSEDNNTLFEDLRVNDNGKLAMIGYFKPIVDEAKEKRVSVISYDIGKHIGDEEVFYSFVKHEADALIITATSFINNTFYQICERIKGYDKKVAILGPSTIMNEALYKDTNVTILGGTQVLDVPNVLKAIRNGKGTKVIHKFSKKIYTRF